MVSDVQHAIVELWIVAKIVVIPVLLECVHMMIVMISNGFAGSVIPYLR